MFEEVPRERRGFAGLTARRFVLGPFVIGGGVLALTLGGSAAIAASVITVSTIGLNDHPPRPSDRHAVVATSSSVPTAQRVAGTSTGSAASGRPPGVTSPEAPKPRPTKSGQKPAPSQWASVVSPTSPVGSGTPRASYPTSTPSTSATPSEPVGNALVFVFGYDTGPKRIKFMYAMAQPAAGPNGSELYTVNDPHPYSAGIATDIQITSGGTVCPPAGSTCTSQQLISAAGGGFFAQVAIDADGNLRVVVERDAPPTAAAQLMPAPTVTPAANPTESVRPMPSTTPSVD